MQCVGCVRVFYNLIASVASHHTLATISCICRITFIMEIYYHYITEAYRFYTHTGGVFVLLKSFTPEDGGYACAYGHTTYKNPDLPKCQGKKNGVARWRSLYAFGMLNRGCSTPLHESWGLVP